MWFDVSPFGNKATIRWKSYRELGCMVRTLHPPTTTAVRQTYYLDLMYVYLVLLFARVVTIDPSIPISRWEMHEMVEFFDNENHNCSWGCWWLSRVIRIGCSPRWQPFLQSRGYSSHLNSSSSFWFFWLLAYDCVFSDSPPSLPSEKMKKIV